MASSASRSGFTAVTAWPTARRRRSPRPKAKTIAGAATYEVVLALDNTGSMAGSKIVSLRQMDAADRAEQETLLDTYKHALGMV